MFKYVFVGPVTRKIKSDCPPMIDQARFVNASESKKSMYVILREESDCMDKPMLIAGTSVVVAIHTHVDKALTHACLSRNASVQSVTQNGSFLFASATIPAMGFESRNVVLNREKSSSNAGFACMRLVT